MPALSCPIRINRAPVLTPWAAVGAERLGGEGSGSTCGSGRWCGGKISWGAKGDLDLGTVRTAPEGSGTGW